MSFKLFISKIFSNIFPFYRENRFYKNLFIENDLWNTPYPNEEEKLRWSVIEKHLGIINTLTSYDGKANILDLGSGRGWMTNLLSSYGNAEGLEPVRDVQKYAVKLFPDILFHNYSLKEFRKKFNKKKFDIVICSEVIEHIPHRLKKEFIVSISNLLNKPGYLILTTPRKEYQESENFIGNQPVEEWLNETEARSLLINNGYKIIQSETLSNSKNSEVQVYQTYLARKA